MKNSLCIFLRITVLSALLLFVGSVFSEPVTYHQIGGDAQSVRVPETVDLQSLGEQSRQSGLPIILVFSAENCSHCESLEQDVLRPLLYSGELKDQGLLRKYKVDGAVSIRDFQGNSRDAEDYSVLRDVEFTPTIQIVDSNGKQIVPPIVGYQTPGLYLAYLREAITVSNKILHEKSH